MVLAPGSLLVSRFLIDRLAGEGGMGQVYRAQDVTTKQWVAVKRLHGAGSTDAAERLLREARLLETIRHPGIVSYIDHGTTAEGAPYLATEWLDGEDLDRRLGRGPLSQSEALLLMEQICEPLAQAHKLGVIHRDLDTSILRRKNSGNCDQGISQEAKRQEGCARAGRNSGHPAVPIRRESADIHLELAAGESLHREDVQGSGGRPVANRSVQVEP